MIVRDAINYAHDLVVKCGKLDLPHKMEAHNAIDRIEAAYKSELQAHVKNFESTINNLVDENARLKAGLKSVMKEYCSRNCDVEFGSESCRGSQCRMSEALAAEGGEK